ncbi:MAG: hypothetical protein R2788_18550 [Saprospiraceae bacterium]
MKGINASKTDIILRELDFTVGDTISLDKLTARMQENEYNVMNTACLLLAQISCAKNGKATNKVGLEPGC